MMNAAKLGLASMIAILLSSTSAWAQSPGSQAKPRGELKRAPIEKPKSQDIKKPSGKAIKRPFNKGKLVFNKPDPTLSPQDMEALRQQSDRAPIYGSNENTETRYTIVLSQSAGVSTGRENAEIRKEQVDFIVTNILQQARIPNPLAQSRQVTSGAINGVTLSNPSAQMLRRISMDRRVLFIQQVTEDRINGLDTNPQSWGLDRIDQRNLPLNTTFDYPDSADVEIWVIDTGIRSSHTEFSGGRVLSHVNYRGDGMNYDCHGHGTHVAGTAAGTTYGVARDAKLRAVKVLDCGGGGYSNITQDGINHVYNNAAALSVANLSLGGGLNMATNLAVANLVASGVPVIVAAGNEGVQACNRSPSSAPPAITVAASDKTDKHSYFNGGASNYGSCVDIYAPGSEIKSAWHINDTATETHWGTSMAAPHVAGIAAALMAENSGCHSAEKINKAIIGMATQGVIDTPTNYTPNRLAYYEPTPLQPNITPTGTNFGQEIIYYEYNDASSVSNEAPVKVDAIMGLGVPEVIYVTGHADTADGESENMILSCNAADVVSTYIRTNYPGVPIIEIAMGETEPFVPTGDGVKEQLNRRVELRSIY